MKVLSDNGSAFRNNATWRWSSFDLRLMLLGIRPAHGKPYHPQIQGKVERLHATIQREILFDKGCKPQDLLDAFRDRYNWVRPHQALLKRTPGSVYTPSSKARPSSMPEPFFPDGAILRKCQDHGIFTYKGVRYRVGRAFIGLPIGILPDVTGDLDLVWGTFTLGPLEDMRV